MLSTKSRQSWLFFFLGLLTAFLSVYAIAVTSAIAVPMPFVDWFKSRGMLPVGVFLWDLAVVFGMGLGIISFVTLLAAFRMAARSTVGLAVLFVAGWLVAGHLVIPVVHDQPLSLFYLRPIHGFALELSLVIATAGALLLARRLWPDNSLRTEPLRGSA